MRSLVIGYPLWGPDPSWQITHYFFILRQNLWVPYTWRHPDMETLSTSLDEYEETNGNPNKGLVMQKAFDVVKLNNLWNRQSIFRWFHDDVIKWKQFPRYWPFVWGIHRSPVNSPHKGQWCGVLMFSLICAWVNGWVNNREAGDLRSHRAHYEVTVMPNLIYARDVILVIYEIRHLHIESGHRCHHSQFRWCLHARLCIRSC